MPKDSVRSFKSTNRTRSSKSQHLSKLRGKLRHLHELTLTHLTIYDDTMREVAMCSSDQWYCVDNVKRLKVLDRKFDKLRDIARTARRELRQLVVVLKKVHAANGLTFAKFAHKTAGTFQELALAIFKEVSDQWRSARRQRFPSSLEMEFGRCCDELAHNWLRDIGLDTHQLRHSLVLEYRAAIDSLESQANGKSDHSPPPIRGTASQHEDGPPSILNLSVNEATIAVARLRPAGRGRHRKKDRSASSPVRSLAETPRSHDSTRSPEQNQAPAQKIATEEPTVHAPAPEFPQNRFRFNPDTDEWEIIFNGKTIGGFHDRVGLGYIARILQCAPNAVHVAELVMPGPEGMALARSSDGPVIDDVQKDQLKKTVNELRAKIQTAKDEGRDYEEDLKDLEEIQAELKRHFKPNGKPRVVNTGLNRMRVSATNAITTAVDAIEEKNSELATHLKACLKRGVHLKYIPYQPVKWDL